MSDILSRHDRENFRERRICRAGEPVVAKLRPGVNELTPPDFRAAADYLLSGREHASAKRCGRFEVGGLVLVRREREAL